MNNSNNSLYDWAPIIISLLALIIPGYWTLKQTRTAKTIESTSSPYEALADRVVELEKFERENSKQLRVQRCRIDKLEAEQHQDRNYIKRMLSWAKTECVESEPPPPPRWYVEAVSYPDTFGSE